MDEFLNPFISMTTWTDANLHERSPWEGIAASQHEGILSNHVGAYGRNNGKMSEQCIMSPGICSLPVRVSNVDVKINSSSVFLDTDVKYGLVSEEVRLQHDIQSVIPVQGGSENVGEDRYPFPLMDEHGLVAGSFVTGHSSMGTDGKESSLYLSPLMMSSNSNSVPQPWQTFPTNPSQLGLPGIVLHADLDNGPIIGNVSANHQLLQVGAYVEPTYESEALENTHIPTAFTSCLDMHMTNNISIQNNQQSSTGDSFQNSTCNVGNSHANPVTPNSASKPRARARRGQATDPHSIAERLRREKIAERMKNLQELVPNSNKTDKASMLDEIIEYVKFLQLQVKVLSMSRVGATGAVMPLITDIQIQGSRNQGLPPAMDPDMLEMQESETFEQEVVKLMESDVTAAMQFLQTKGLCLMPVALASAISTRKGSSTAIPQKKTNAVGHSANSNSSRVVVKDRSEEQFSNGLNKVTPKEEPKIHSSARKPKCLP